MDALKAWSMQDPRLHILRHRHEGIIPALNAGLAWYQAPLVARMDTDDIAHPDHLAKLVAFLESHPEIAVVSCFVNGYPPEAYREISNLFGSAQ
jgi:cellulose synthase/poly-beta-1,6-N-acetylglucosamine synthase-like glycosyltransferase